jgi:hypothetical protein
MPLEAALRAHQLTGLHGRDRVNTGLRYPRKASRRSKLPGPDRASLADNEKRLVNWAASRKDPVETRPMVGTRGAGRKWAPDIRPGLPAARRAIT